MVTFDWNFLWRCSALTKGPNFGRELKLLGAAKNLVNLTANGPIRRTPVFQQGSPNGPSPMQPNLFEHLPFNTSNM